jgi:16S rRNA (uracil1498-N3)-methyltransferase
MPDFRSFAPELCPEKDQIALTPFESHHLVTTNRAREDDTVVLFDGAGIECEAILKIANRRRAILTAARYRKVERSCLQITLAIALIKGKTFDTILRQTAELGVSCIQPLITERTQVQVKNSSAKREKWTQHLIEGCKQSGNPWLPNLTETAGLEDYLENANLESSVVASLEDNSTPWKDLSISKSTTLFIGPEGDFTRSEYDSLEKKGAQAVSLGPYVLKSETAVVAAISQLSQYLRLDNR